MSDSLSVYTFGRAEIEAGIDVVNPYALISISTPPRTKEAHNFSEDDSGAYLPPDGFRLDYLRLRFDDISEWPQGLSDRERAFVGLYSPELAAQVAAYVRAHARHAIVIHCDAGISRSQGMALAIAEHRGILHRPHTPGWPNRLVYRLTYDALRPGEGRHGIVLHGPTKPTPLQDVTIPKIKKSSRTDPYRVGDPYRA